jgi:hypothetical protein
MDNYTVEASGSERNIAAATDGVKRFRRQKLEGKKSEVSRLR